MRGNNMDVDGMIILKVDSKEFGFICLTTQFSMSEPVQPI
jgi:hypothetical protein